MAEAGGARRLRELGLAALSLAAALAAAEIAVRAFVGAPPERNVTRVPESIRAPSPSPDEIPYLLAPNAEAVQDFGSNPRGYFDGEGTLTYRINSLGLRDREVERLKAPGVRRILAVGDSFTFGTGVRLEDVYPSRLQRLLDESGPPGRSEVLNLGVMGFNTAHEVALLREVGLGLSPDLVLLCYVLNDAEVLSPEEAAPAEPGWRRWPSLLAQQLAARLESRRLREAAIAKTRADYRRGAPGWQLVQRSLAQARDLARAHGFELALVIFPYLWQLDEHYPFADAHAAVARAAQRLGLPVLDLFDAFRGEDGPSLWVHPDNQHPNERAHEIAARAIHAWLLAR
jgi:lysophospholipase L1-like esterase